MSRPTLVERMSLRRIGMRRLRQDAQAMALTSPLLRWQFGAPTADRLAIVPQDLRGGDPSFWDELSQGDFGLAGFSAPLDGGTPFDIEPPSEAWLRELHGFAWLRHLKAANAVPAEAMARELVLGWIAAHRNRRHVAWSAPVTARRLISWLSNADILLANIEARTYEAITSSMADQLIYLSATWRGAPEGYPRLQALIALAFANLCIEGHDRQLAQVTRTLERELDRQIFADGGHISRNPQVLVALLLDLVPLRQCFRSCSMPSPAGVEAAITRMMPMLRWLRLGDGSLARFNGSGRFGSENLAAVLSYDSGAPVAVAPGSQSRYQRLERGAAVIIVDAGPCPAIEHSAQASAGCLSFELSIGTRAVFVNGGAPGPAAAADLPASRSTASHNAMSIADRSSAELLDDAGFTAVAGGMAMRGPRSVSVDVSGQDGHGRATLSATHDGYRSRFGIIVHRSLALSEDGTAIEGVDRIAGHRGQLRLARDLPFAIRFHLANGVLPLLAAQARHVTLRMKDGANFRFEASGATIDIDASANYTEPHGAGEALQIVLRGSTYGESEVRWSLQREGAAG